MTTITTPRRTTGEYAAKLTDPHTAVEQIESHSTVALGQAAGQPPALMRALADRAREHEIDEVKLYYFHAEQPMQDSLLRYELMGALRPHSMFLQRAERELIKQGDRDGRKVVSFVPTAFSQSIRLFADRIPVDTFLVSVSPMDANGYFTFGTNNDYTSSVARQAKRLIVEVNAHMPRVFGASALHVSEVDAIVEHDEQLPELPQRPIGDVDRTIARRVAELVPDHACLQIGVGGLPQAVCEALADRTDLGIHSEVLTPALAGLIESGVITNRYKAIHRGTSVFTFAMGDRAFYEFLDDNRGVESHPVDHVNDPAVIALNDNVVSVNSTIEMDLTGACNSEWINGHQYSAAGGQVDFVRGAYNSRGGLSVIAFASTAKQGTISKIVPRLSGPVTTARNDVHHVATEYGMVDLKGLSSTQRAQSLIALAHPDHRAELTEAARERHLI